MSSIPVATDHPRVQAQWRVRPPAPPAEVERIMSELGIGPVMAAVLWSRGMREDIPAFLDPPLRPTDIPSLADAAARIHRAIEQQERILIHGDYDADGISGTAVLTLGLRELGARIDPFLPNRLTDGYGIHPDRVPEHAERADLFVTVDCGITNLDEIAELRRAGVDVIVTDHHSPGSALPDALVVHPRHASNASPGTPELTGAGVAFHLLWAVRTRFELDPPLDYADLATLGTVADVAPLLGENRALIREGLLRMRDSRWPGLRAAVKQSSLRGEITARDVAFVLGPRLNAAGRLGEADKGLELLVTASERRARELAAYLDARNDDRRKIQDAMFAQAVERVDPGEPAIVVGDDEWHPGVMGIVASKILERFYRPVFIHAKGKGSVRSTPGISAVGALHAAAPHLRRFGGHAQAAGFALDPEHVPGFRAAVISFVAGHPTPVPELVADALLTPAAVDEGLLRAVHRLEPFGEGHASPRFALTGCLDMARAVGRDGNTLQLRIGGIKGVAWQLGDLATSLPLGAPVTAIVELRENEWNGTRSIEFLADDVRAGDRIGFASNATPSGRFQRGRSNDPNIVPVLAASDVPDAAAPLQLETMFLDSDGPEPTERLERWIAAGHAIAFDLGREALHEIELVAASFPTIHDLRRAFVSKQRGERLPFQGPKAARIDAAFRELDLLDERGRLRRGERRDPTASDTLRKGLIQRYKLRSFVDGYRVLDDDAFDSLVTTLFGSP